MSELTDVLVGVIDGKFDDELDRAMEVVSGRRQALESLAKLRQRVLAAPDPDAETKAGEGDWWRSIASNEIEVFGVRYKVEDAPGQRATLQCVVNGDPVYMMTKTPPWWLAGYIRETLMGVS